MTFSEKSSEFLLPERIPKPESLEAKFKLMVSAPLDKRMKRKHLAVYGFILDWFHSKYGDALASVRHIVAQLRERDRDGVGLYAGDVHSALSDLVAWGYLILEKGTGRRASRYTPVWEIRSVRNSPNATDDERSVLVSPNACVLVSPNTTGASVRKSPNEDPSTSIRSTDPETMMEGMNDCAAPLAPLPAGAGGPAVAVTSQGGFEELWATYAYRKKIKEARAEYKRLAPDADQHVQLVDAARLWRQAADTRTDASAPRKYLHTWLRDEEFECDPPTAFQPKERKPKTAKPKAAEVVPANDNAKSDVPDFLRGRLDQWPAGRQILEIVESDVVEQGSDMWADLTFENDAGAQFEHRIWLRAAYGGDAEQEGHRYFADLVTATGLASVEDTTDLHFVKISAEVKNGRMFYRSIDEQEAA